MFYGRPARRTCLHDDIVADDHDLRGQGVEAEHDAEG